MRTIDSYIFGDIVLMDMPFSDGGQSKIRPILILAKDKQDYIVMKITTQIDKQEHCDVMVSPSEHNGLRAVSVCKTKKIGVFPQDILHKKIGTLSSNDKRHIKTKLRDFVDGL